MMDTVWEVSVRPRGLFAKHVTLGCLSDDPGPAFGDVRWSGPRTILVGTGPDSGPPIEVAVNDSGDVIRMWPDKIFRPCV